MSHLASVFGPGTQYPRSRMFWLVFGSVVAGQLFAFWLLCVHQVRKAEARQNEALVEQMALADCLQFIPGSTIASCTSRMGPNAQPRTAARPAANSPLAGALPVSYSYR